MAFRCSRLRSHLILNAVGSLLLPTLVVSLVVCLMFGCALICRPRMPPRLNVNEATRSPTWIEKIYSRGTTLNPLGYGDISPRTTAMRLTALSEAPPSPKRSSR